MCKLTDGAGATSTATPTPTASGAQHIQQRISNALREQALQDLLRRVVTALSHDLLFHR